MAEQVQSAMHVVGVVYPSDYVEALQQAISEHDQSAEISLGRVALVVLGDSGSAPSNFVSGASLVTDGAEAAAIGRAISLQTRSEAFRNRAAREVSAALARARNAARALGSDGDQDWWPRPQEVSSGKSAVGLVFRERDAMDQVHLRAHEIQAQRVEAAASAGSSGERAGDEPSPAVPMPRSASQRRARASVVA